MRKKTVSFLLAVVMLLSLAACGGGNQGNNQQGGTQSNGNQDANQPSGGAQYYNLSMGTDPTSMDISRISDTYSTTIVTNVMEGLVRLGEENGDYVMRPGDAQTWDLSEDGTVWTFHLGDNKWSDGEPVTAEQYVYSLKRSIDPETGCPNDNFLSPIKGYDEIRNNGADPDTLAVEALDEKTLQITLAYPMASFLEMCSNSIYFPLRQDKVEEYGDKYGTEPEYTLFNGPYTMTEWVHNSSITLTKNPHYWDAANVQIETVHYAILGDSITVYNAYDTGDLDYVSTSEAEWMDKYLSDSANNVHVQTPTATLAYSFYNTKDELFQNANIRKAFTLAMDRVELNEMCFSGSNIPTYGWINSSISVGSTNFREYAGNTIQEMTDELTAQGKTPRDVLIEGMEELGLGSDPSTLTVTFSLAGTDDWFRTYGEYLQQSYQSTLGVNMEISFNDWAIFYDDVQNGNYQIAYMAWGAYYNDPYDMLSLFHTNNDAIMTGWSNAEFDKLVTEALGVQDEAARIEMYKQAEDILLREECAVCPVLTFVDNYFFRPYVTGYSTLTFGSTGLKGMSTGARP